jgi:hypothetical protein
VLAAEVIYFLQEVAAKPVATQFFCLSMISAQTPPAFVARETRYPLFRIMLQGPAKRIFPCNCPLMGRRMQARNIASRQSG